MKYISFLIALLAMISLAFAGTGNEAVVVGGTVYQSPDITNVISNASIEVTCFHHNASNVLTTISDSSGEYSVTYAITECGCNDNVQVNAVKGSLTGSQMDSITMCGIQPFPSLKLDVGIVNVPMIPEFGLIIGLATIAASVGLFFLVRKR